MTSFGSMLAATKGIVKLIKVTDKDRYLSYLPVAHGMERWLGEVSIIAESALHVNAMVHCIFFPFSFPRSLPYTPGTISFSQNLSLPLLPISTVADPLFS